MLEYLISVINRMGHWGYLVIFLAAALESAAFLGLFVPGESLVLVTGFLAAQGTLDLDVSIWTITLGAFVGDSLGYELGRRLDRATLIRYGRHVGLTEERVDKADAFFQKHGGKSVFLGRFIGFARAIVPFLAGSTRMRYRVFFPFNVLGAGIWSSVLVLLGYFLGASWQHAARWVGAASLVLGGFIVFCIVLVWLHRIVSGHQQHLQRGWHRILGSPLLTKIRGKFAPQIAFLQARLSPNSYLGLSLSIGAAFLLAAGWLFGGIAEDVATNDPLTKVDVLIAHWLHAQVTSGMANVMIGIGTATGPLAITAYVLMTALYLMVRREWYWFAALLLTVPSGMLVNTLMKLAFHRARPSFEHPLLSLATYSFPSGHTAGATLFFGVLACIVVGKVRSWSWRIGALLVALTLVLTVAFSRMALGVHYLSDVLGGMAEGVTWLAFCMTGLHTYQGHRAARGDARLKHEEIMR